jgi:hypothetical protein
MATKEKKTGEEIVGRFAAVDETFEQLEARRRARARDLLRRVLSDLSLQDDLCREARMHRDGFHGRSEHPGWARRLAEVLRNPEGRYSTPLRKQVFEYARELHSEHRSGDSEALSLVEFLTARMKVPVLSEIAHELVGKSQKESPHVYGN